jgi:hypothetical protein
VWEREEIQTLLREITDFKIRAINGFLCEDQTGGKTFKFSPNSGLNGFRGSEFR